MPVYIFIINIHDKEDTSKNFKQLVGVLEKQNKLAVIRPIKRLNLINQASILVIPVKPSSTGKRNYTIPLILFIATLGSIFLAGLTHVQNFNQLLTQNNWISGFIAWITLGRIKSGSGTGNVDVLLVSIIYAISLMSIIGIHELGHFIAAKIHGIDASPPYFIPMPVGDLGTFGAFITQKKPAMDRNTLFDIGISGPIAGFIIALGVLISGLLLSVPVNPSDAVSGAGLPFNFILMDILTDFFFSGYPGKIIVLHPLAFAGWVGLLITGLNLIPSSMLDGGHVARSVLDEKSHQIVSFIGVIIMTLTGFYLMAMLILFLAPRHPGALDEVTPLSPKRKMVILMAIFIGILTFPFPNYGIMP
ncbi:MAG: site-2 protease family protein [Candidatus Hodarchaeales archaeon]